MDYSQYPNFSEEEFKCKHCGEVDMKDTVLNFLQAWRDHIGAGVTINSRFRCGEHNNAVSSTGTDGPHTSGLAIDISTQPQLQYKLLNFAFNYEPRPTGIGIAKTFTHLDWLTAEQDDKYKIRPNVWKY